MSLITCLCLCPFGGHKLLVGDTNHFTGFGVTSQGLGVRAAGVVIITRTGTERVVAKGLSQ